MRLNERELDDRKGAFPWRFAVSVLVLLTLLLTLSACEGTPGEDADLEVIEGAVREALEDSESGELEEAVREALDDSPTLDPELARALDNSDASEVERLLAEGVDPNAVLDSLGWTLLHYAVSDPAITTVLLDAGADIEARDWSGQTPLALAVDYGKIATAELLLARGADIETTDDAGRTPLWNTVREYVWDIEDNYNAKAEERLTAIEALLDHGADPDTTPTGGGAWYGPIHMAVAVPDLVRLLLDYGADPNLPDHVGETPLHYAAKVDALDAARMLLDGGADHSRTDNFAGYQPLHWAVGAASTEMVRLLLEHGADINAQDLNRNTPLYFAINTGSPEMVGLLLDHGADATPEANRGLDLCKIIRDEVRGRGVRGDSHS